MSKADEPAFPGYYGGEIQPHIGMTKREVFAMAALQGLCANNLVQEKAALIEDQTMDEFTANLAVQYADALIKALDES